MSKRDFDDATASRGFTLCGRSRKRDSGVGGPVSRPEPVKTACPCWNFTYGNLLALSSPPNHTMRFCNAFQS